MENKKLYYALIIFAAASIIIIVAIIFYRNAQKNEVSQKNETEEQIAVESMVGTDGSNDKLLPPEIIAVKDNNVTGTIQKIDSQNLQIVTNDEKAEIKNFNIEQNTSVASIINNKIESKSLSDLKVGKLIYLQYEKDTNNVLTITIQ